MPEATARGQIPPDPREQIANHRVDTLADRLRALADEVESAERYGVPLPGVFYVYNLKLIGHVSFAATGEEFAAWLAYTDAAVEEYDYEGDHWRRARADVNGLSVEFSTTDSPEEMGSEPGRCGCPFPESCSDAGVRS